MKLTIALGALFLIAACSSTDNGYHTANSAVVPHVSPMVEFSYKDCQRGRETGHVRVKTNKENYNFDPSCSERFYQSFMVENKTECVVESSMCTGFTGMGEMAVHCKNGEAHKVHFDCTATQ